MAQVLRELEALGITSTADLTTDLMARWIASRGPQANPNTLNGLLATAAAACSYAVAEGLLERPPLWRRLRPRGRAMTMNAPPSYDDVARLLSYLKGHSDRWEDRRLSALAHAIALTGLRLGEALHLRIEDVDLRRRHLVVVDRPDRPRLKTEGSARVVPLPDALVRELETWLPISGPDWVFPGVRRKGPWTGGPPGGKALDQLRRAARDAGVSRVTWHALRHAYGTYALERWGVPLWIVQRVLGHTDPRTTQRYLHLDGSPAIAAAVRGIGYPPEQQS